MLPQAPDLRAFVLRRATRSLAISPGGAKAPGARLRRGTDRQQRRHRPAAEFAKPGPPTAATVGRKGFAPTVGLVRLAAWRVRFRAPGSRVTNRLRLLTVLAHRHQLLGLRPRRTGLTVGTFGQSAGGSMSFAHDPSFPLLPSADRRCVYAVGVGTTSSTAVMVAGGLCPRLHCREK